MNAKHAVITGILAVWISGAAALRADERVISPGLGFQPAHAYAISGIESIDKAAGSLSLHIPLAQLPAGPAGFSSGPTLVYNNKYWEVEMMFETHGLRRSESGGWRLTMVPELSLEPIESTGENDPCGYYLNIELFQLRLIDPDGGRHALMLSKPVRTMPGACTPGIYRMSTLAYENAPSVWYTIDGSYLRLEMDAPGVTGSWPNNSSWTLYRQDGTSVRYEVASKAFYLRDRNGNRISVRKAVDPADPKHTYEVMADEFGRSIRLDHFGIDRDEVSQAGHDGTPLVWKVYYGRPGPMIPNSYICDNSLILNCRFQTPPLVATRLELPNGLAYTFGYERTTTLGSNYRELRTMTLPTGARVDYGYRLDAVSAPTNYFHVLANPVTSKTVTADGATVERWEYGYNVAVSTGSYSQSTHKAPDGGITLHEFQPVGYKLSPREDAGQIVRVTHPDGSRLLRIWDVSLPAETTARPLNPNPWVHAEYAITANASGTAVATSVKVYTTDKNGNVTSVEERGWTPYSNTMPPISSFPPIGKTVTAYLNGATDAANRAADANAYSYPSLAGPAVPRNLPASTEILDANGAVKSSRRLVYAETNPARTVGNLAAEYLWDSTRTGYGAIAPGTELTAANAVVKTFEYTARGNLRREVDGRGAATTYDYGSLPGCGPDGGAVSDLYRTGSHQGEDAAGPILNWTYRYGCLSGKLVSSTDPNSLVTGYSYDAYGRPTEITDGDYRKTVHTYNDAMLWIVTQKDVETFGDLRNVSVLHYDPLGRVRLARQLETAVADPYAAAADETAGVRTETRYAYRLNRNETTVSNPYRLGEADAPTRGWTVKRLDTMGRVCAEEWFPGAAVPAVSEKCAASPGATGAVLHRYDASMYSTLEEISDTSGRTRQLYRDVRGRLIAVREDPASAKYVTYYQYDALDNLAGVRQAGSCPNTNPVGSPCAGGQTREFTYDSLERLATARDPELGPNPLSYRYDANGNVTSKVSPGPPALLASFTYDSLNRLKTREYSDGTPAVTLCYDGRTWSGSFGGCNGSPVSPGRGHLTMTGSTVSSTSYAYNTAGLVTASSQSTAGQPYSFRYTYNAAFALATETYPRGRKVTADFDDVGRARRLFGQLGRTVKPYAGGAGNEIRYAAHGSVRELLLGNGVLETREYNSRLQATRIQAGGSLTLINCYQSGDDPGCAALATVASNVGDLQGQKILRGTQEWSQKFTYDAVGRLAAASEPGGWQQNYAYDPYGNRWISSAAGLPVQGVAPAGAEAFDASTNRIRGTENYDARGNLKSYGAYTLTYDGEDRLVAAGGSVPSAAYEYDGEGRRVRAHVCPGSLQCSPGPDTETAVYVYDAFGKLAAEYGTVPGDTGTRYFTLDQVGSTRLETDRQGQPVRCGDYAPFGEEIGAGVAGRSSCFAGGDNKIKFAGKQRDAGTGLDFSLARYYSGAQGRFTSDDPLNIPALQRLEPKKFAEVIANPQNWNGYAYALNSPLKNADPDGFLTILVAGTWNHQEHLRDAGFQKAVESTFGESAVFLPNDRMGLSTQARSQAAKQLNAMIAAHKFAPGEKLNVVALSHGGNVVAEAVSKGLSHKIDTLVTMGTPIRPDYPFNESKIGTHLNVFSKKDSVQPMGGMVVDLPLTIVPGFIPASRKVNSPGVKNLDATSVADGHTKMWSNDRTWNTIVAPEIKK